MVRKYKFRSNFDLCLTGDLPQMLPGVIAYGIRFDPRTCTTDNHSVMDHRMDGIRNQPTRICTATADTVPANPIPIAWMM